MAPASASLLPATSSATAGTKRPAATAASVGEHPLVQDGVTAGKNNESSQQQQQLECPRCKSGNTKFCYYNNYSTTQPRHFCRACRRYWTHGGTLRNVPVGGACRRGGNKRHRQSSPSASPAESAEPAEDTYRLDISTTPLFPFLSDGVFLPQFDLGLGGDVAAFAGLPWAPAGSGPADLYDGLAAPWGDGDGTLAGGAWDDFAGIELI